MQKLRHPNATKSKSNSPKLPNQRTKIMFEYARSYMKIILALFNQIGLFRNYKYLKNA